MSTPTPPSGELIQRVQSNIRELKFTTLSVKAQAGVYLFFSFDLVNSTQFKASHPQDWPVVVQRFYELVVNELTTRLSSTIVWKFVGDEVLFYKRLTKRQELYDALPAAHDALLATTELLHKTFPLSRELLAVKAAVWIAEAQPVQPSDIANISSSPRNIIVEAGRSSAPTRDFLGPQIDIGFRISKFALRQRLVVSAELACLLYRARVQHPKVEDQLRVVSLETLKGVWSGRHYPILWFERDWIKIAETFLFDEHLVSDLARSVKNHAGDLSRLKEIEKIFSDLGRIAEIDMLSKAIDEAVAKPSGEKIEIEIPKDRYAEIHCVAVCFSPEGKVLAARRPASKRRFPSCFEFGCGQLRLGESFSDCLKRAYKDDFGVDLVLREPLIPVTTYEIRDEQEQRSIPGIIFFAEISNPDSMAESFSKEKHAEIRWLDPADLDGMTQECVPDFAATTARASELWNRSRTETR